MTRGGPAVAHAAPRAYRCGREAHVHREDDHRELRAAFEGFESADDFRAMFGDKSEVREFIDFAMPAPLRRYLRRLRRGTARLSGAERPFFETERAVSAQIEAARRGERQSPLRLAARMYVHPAFPDFMHRVFTAMGARADRLAREDPSARDLVTFIHGFAGAFPERAAAVYRAACDLDRAQRQGVPGLWAVLDPIEDVGALESGSAFRRRLGVYQQVAELGYRPYAKAFLALLRAGEPKLRAAKGFGAAVHQARRYLDDRWPSAVALADPDVVFLRNAAAHMQIEPLLPKRGFRLCDNPSGGAPPTVRDFTGAEMARALGRLLAVAMPGGSIQRAADGIRFRMFLQHGLVPLVEEVREMTSKHRDALNRYAEGGEPPDMFQFV